MIAEALVLGLSGGLVCLASCGAVLVPWLVVQQRRVAATAWLLAQVLAGRLTGYLLFAVVAWAAGLVLVSDDLKTRALVFGLAHLSLAATLFWYVFSSGKAEALPYRNATCPERAAASRRRALSGRSAVRLRFARLGPAALGLLTGINICPPFVVAAVRAAEFRSLAAALGFFAVFFVGTSVWFLPFLATGAAWRFPESRFVARIAMGVIGVYYAYLGTVTLGWRVLHG